MKNKNSINIILVFVFLICNYNYCIAQQINAGPVIGGVTPESARIYYKTSEPANLSIELADNEVFNNPTLYNLTTTSEGFNSIIVDIEGLENNTKYYFRTTVAGNLHDVIGSFKTFPEEDQVGYYKVVVGSCNYDNVRSGGGATSEDNYMNDVLFGGIKDFDPNIVLHLGDWNYPPSNFGANYNLDPDKVARSFAFRYQDYNMSKFITPYFPLDYVYDDAYSYNGNAGWTWANISFDGDRYYLTDVDMDPGIRVGAIKGYFDHFPGYKQTDTSGVHHSFKLGNIEFFVLDTRNSKDPIHAGFRFDNLFRIYNWVTPPNHSTLGEIQKEWLLEGLKNSDADWKVICSSVVFNKKFKDFMGLVLLGQLFDKSLVERASAIAYMWAGYPKDMNDLLSTIRNDSIKDVIILSGDTHSSMMDDGRNSAIPEISSSGWAAGNEGLLNFEIEAILDDLSLPLTTKDFLWNGGGVGVDNDYVGDSYARLEFFGQDSMRACVIDEFDQVISCMTLPFKGERDTMISTTSIPDYYNYHKNSRIKLLYPNPTRTFLRIEFEESNRTSTESQILVHDTNGKIVFRKNIYNQSQIDIPTSKLNSGVYILSYINGDYMESKKFVKR